MDVLSDIVLRLLPIAVGYIVLNALLSNIYTMSGGHWRALAMTYPMPAGRLFAGPSTFRLFEIVELYNGEDDAKGQSWWMIARIYQDGLAIYMPPIPMLNYPPIFIPLSDLRIEWRHRSDACAIAAAQAPGLAIMIGDTLGGMLEALSDDRATATPSLPN